METRQSAHSEGQRIEEALTLQQDSHESPPEDVEKRLKALARAVSHSCPTADIEQMLDEIEAGYCWAP